MNAPRPYPLLVEALQEAHRAAIGPAGQAVRSASGPIGDLIATVLGLVRGALELVSELLALLRDQIGPLDAAVALLEVVENVLRDVSRIRFDLLPATIRGASGALRRLGEGFGDAADALEGVTGLVGMLPTPEELDAVAASLEDLLRDAPSPSATAPAPVGSLTSILADLATPAGSAA